MLMIMICKYALKHVGPWLVMILNNMTFMIHKVSGIISLAKILHFPHPNPAWPLGDRTGD